MDKKQKNNIIIASGITAFVLILSIVITLICVGGKKEANHYTLNFYVDDEIVEKVTLEEGKTLTDIPSVPEKEGYNGFWDKTDFENIKASADIYAVYSPKVLEIKFFADQKLIEKKTVNYGETLDSIPDVPEKEGFQNGRWNHADFSNLKDDLEVNALYDVIKLEIKFYKDNEEQELVATKTVDYGSTLMDVPAVPAAIGMVASWDVEDFSIITENKNVHAVYTTLVLEIKFYVEGELYKTLEVNYGEDLEYVPAVPEKENHIASWNVVDFSNITEDLEVNATYEVEVFTYNEDADTIAITGLVDKNASSVTIPATLKGKPVTKIAKDAFNNGLGAYPKLVSLTFAEGSNVETIENGAFYYSNIEEITIPKSVKNIDNAAFFVARGLKMVTFEEGIELETINKQAFYGCSNLESITLPASVTIIDKEAFAWCTKLKTFVLDENIISLGEWAFNGCSSLETIILSNNLARIEYATFHLCEKLEAVYYLGSSAQLNHMHIDLGNDYNEDFVDAAKYCYNEEPNQEGLFWHYEENEIVTQQFFTVSFSVNDELYDTRIVASGMALLDIPTVPEKIGKTNERWSVTDFSSVLDNINVNALYDILVLDIKFYAGDEIVDTKHVNYGENYTNPLPLAPSTNGFTGEWDQTIFENVTENIDVHATKTKMDVFFYVGNTLVITKSVTYGETLTDIPQVPVTEGYSGFWDTTNFANITQNKYVHAKRIKIDIRFFDGEENLIVTKQVYYGNKLTDVPPVPELENCFGFWSDEDLGYEIADFSQIVFGKDGNVDFYARYTSNFEYTEYENSITITKATNVDMSTIVIPETINGKPVTEIGVEAFVGISLLKVYLADNVTIIGDKAFYKTGVRYLILTENSKLTSIGEEAFNCCGIVCFDFPKSVTTIGEKAFYGSETEEFRFDTFGSPSLTTIGKEAFTYCQYLESITIPKSITSIGESAFERCVNLKTVTFESGSQLETIGRSAFESCIKLQNIVLPNGVKTIDEDAFYGCKNLVNIQIPKTVTNMGESIFSNCLELKTVTFVEESSLKDLPAEAFYKCEKLESIALPTKLVTIGDQAFENCTSLTSITLPNTLTTIFEEVFASSGLTSITIPKSVTHVGNKAFKDCSALVTATFEENSELVYLGKRAFESTGIEAMTTLPSGLLILSEATFANCKQLTTVIIPDGVSHIEYHQFDGCVKLENVTIGNHVSLIKNHAFGQCASLLGISYNNTRDHWGIIEKSRGGWIWGTLANSVIIHCLDGDVIEYSPQQFMYN